MSMPTMRVSGSAWAAPTARPDCVAALPLQCTIAVGTKPSTFDWCAISTIVVA
jgi:hypothetical protein